MRCSGNGRADAQGAGWSNNLGVSPAALKRIISVYLNTRA